LFGILGTLVALSGCGAAEGGSSESVEQTSETTAAVKASQSATVPGVGTFPIDSVRFETTITAPTGTWVPKLLEDEATGRLIPSVELEVQSPRRKYTLSDVLVTSIATSTTPQGAETSTVTLSFASIRSR
jgi:type VI protein secretion system component Hcp